MAAASARIGELRLPCLAAPATPARTASRFRRRPTGRGLCARCCCAKPTCSPSASARATRCAWKPACASTAMTSTRPPARSRPVWSGRSQKRRRSEGGFPGAARIQDELADGPSATRVGIKPEGRAPAREGAEILSASGERIGIVTRAASARASTARSPWATSPPTTPSPARPCNLIVRGKPLPARVAPLPFVPHRYARKS